MSRPSGIARAQAESVHEGVRYDLEVDSATMDVTEEVGAIADLLTRRWSIGVSLEFDPRSALPVTPAWTPGQALRPPSWEH